MGDMMMKELLVEPFRPETWCVLGTSIVAILGMVALPSFLIRNYFFTNGFRLFILVGWLFFVLVEIYYGGMLTSCCSHMSDMSMMKVPLPFKTVQDVVRAYPEWKLIHQVGFEYNIIKEVVKGMVKIACQSSRCLQDI